MGNVTPDTAARNVSQMIHASPPTVDATNTPTASLPSSATTSTTSANAKSATTDLEKSAPPSTHASTTTVMSTPTASPTRLSPVRKTTTAPANLASQATVTTAKNTSPPAITLSALLKQNAKLSQTNTVKKPVSASAQKVSPVMAIHANPLVHATIITATPRPHASQTAP